MSGNEQILFYDLENVYSDHKWVYRDIRYYEFVDLFIISNLIYLIFKVFLKTLTNINIFNLKFNIFNKNIKNIKKQVYKKCFFVYY